MSDGFPQRVAHLFGRVLTAAPDERAALLTAHREREPDVVRRVEWMLADRESETPTRVVDAPPVAPASRTEPVAPASRRCEIAAGDDTKASDGDGNAAMGNDAPDAPAMLDAGAAPPAPRDPATASNVFPGYEIVRRLSQGGQGVVYQAVETATKRKVALKVLLEGVHASKSARRRFEREIEIVAQFRHPHIIGVLHAGQSGDGRQFYAMDYVRGEPLTTFVRSKKLPLDAALELFATLCDAVQYAHQRGIIHRDLKPSNVLVDTEGRLRVLDFGLAKSLGATDQTLISLTGQAVGTLAYMSPEQTRGNPDEIDTRADVYALGVILYELLVGQYPYPVTGSIAEILNHIASTPPTPPSRNWKADSGVVGRSSSRGGRCPIDADLETIVLKALAKERDRRYPGAGDLARDIRHYLAGEPIEARRDSALYVLRKTLGRYRLAAGVAAAFVILAIGFGVVMWMQARQIAQQRDRARDAESLALAERDRAESERGRAQAQSERAESALGEAKRALADAQRGRRVEWRLRRSAWQARTDEIERQERALREKTLPSASFEHQTLGDAVRWFVRTADLKTSPSFGGRNESSVPVTVSLESQTLEKALRTVVQAADGGRGELAYLLSAARSEIYIGSPRSVEKRRRQMARRDGAPHPFYGAQEVYLPDVLDESPVTRLRLLDRDAWTPAVRAMTLDEFAVQFRRASDLDVICDWDALERAGHRRDSRFRVMSYRHLKLIDAIESAELFEDPAVKAGWALDGSAIRISTSERLADWIKDQPPAVALRLVTDRFQTCTSRDELIGQLNADASLDQRVRCVAVWTAETLDDDPRRLAYDCLSVLKRPGEAQAQYEMAFQRIERLKERVPQLDKEYPQPYAIGLYRVGRHEEALRALSEDGSYAPLFMPYRAMAAFKLGRIDIALDALDRAYLLGLSSKSVGEWSRGAAGEAGTLILGEAGAEQRRTAVSTAYKRVKPLFDRLTFLDDVSAALRDDPALSDDERAIALRVAARFPQDPDVLSYFSWEIACAPGNTQSEYARSLRLAREAVRVSRGGGRHLAVLGAACYRSGLFDDALAALRRSDTLYSGGAPGLRIPRHVAFLAMTLWRLGCRDEAWAEFEALCRLMASPDRADDAAAERLLDEAAELIAASTAEPPLSTSTPPRLVDAASSRRQSHRHGHVPPK